jgi:CO/xanthine dehydrogenase FAD-binding subunit
MTAIAVVVVTEGFVHQARLALAGVWPEPARLADSADLLVGGPLIIRRIRRVAEAVEQEVTPLDDDRSSAGYRGAMAGVLSYCALEQCRKGASGL